MSTDDESTPAPPRGASPARPPASFLDAPAAEYAAPVLRDLAASLREAEAALPALLDAALAGRYRIVSQIGRGGMAVVYVAEDVRHGRPVAIKLIRPELARDIGVARFLHEIAFLGRLQHPHIPPLLDSGEVQGLPFYVMPHVDGESLRTRLAREPRLSVEESLRIARDVADALEHAHEHGVVHRDVKPDNILLQGRHALVADFGIARALTRAASDTLTVAGVTLGTPAYMSPEQAAGNVEVDGRSDVFSLGVVLHEMLAGEAPFRGATPQEVIAQVISRPAPSVRERQGLVPLSVERIVARALAKEAVRRFESAGELREAIEVALAELARPLAPPVAAPPVPAPPAPSRVEASVAPIDPSPSVSVRAEGERDTARTSGSRSGRRLRGVVGAALVLAMAAGAGLARELELGPFAPEGPQGPVPWIFLADFEASGDNPALAGAVRDLLAVTLDESGVVTTVPRARMRQGLRLAGLPDTVRIDESLGRDLAIRGGVSSVITGRVDQVGDAYSLLFRVIDADSGTTLLTEREVASDAGGVIPAVDRASLRLRSRLREQGGTIRRTRPLVEVATPSLAAFQRYAESGALQRRPGETQSSIPPLREAIAIDPEFASAWLALGIRFHTLFLDDSARTALAEARRHSARLSDLELLLLEAWEARLRRELQAALGIYDRVLRRYPNALLAHTGRSIVLHRLGRFEEALEAQRRVLADDPFGPSDQALFNISEGLMDLGLWREAADVVRQLGAPRSHQKRLWLAVATDDWQTADSLGRRVADLPAAGPRFRRDGARALASALAARGAVRGADSLLIRAGDVPRGALENPYEASMLERDRLLLAFSAGVRLRPSDSRSIERAPRSDLLEGAWGPVASEPASARRVLDHVRAWPSPRRAALGIAPKLLAAMAAADSKRWRDVVSFLAADATGTHCGEGVVPMWMHARWLVAQAYERLEMPDSAAWYYQRLLDPVEAVRNEEILARGLVYSFAHQRLVLLHARMGHVDEARRHWVIFHSTFTRPDPELVPLVEEARAALAKAERERG